MKWTGFLCAAPSLLAACGPQGEVGGDEGGTSSGLDETSAPTDGDTSTTAPGDDGSETTGSSAGTDATSTLTDATSGADGTDSVGTDQTTTTEPVDPCPGVPVPQPPFYYTEGRVERIDVDHLAVELTIEGVTRADPSHRLLFELGPDELAPGIYTLPVEHQCFSDCDNPDFTEDVVIEVVSVDDCLAAAFLEVPTFSCVEVLVSPCGGFVEPIL